MVTAGRRGGGDFDCVGNITDLELEIESLDLIDRERDAGSRGRPEAFPMGVDAVFSGREEGDCVVTGLVGDGLSDQTLVDAKKTTTSVPGATAPVTSVMRPVTWPVGVCGHADVAKQ